MPRYDESLFECGEALCSNCRAYCCDWGGGKDSGYCSCDDTVCLDCIEEGIGGFCTGSACEGKKEYSCDNCVERCETCEAALCDACSEVHKCNTEPSAVIEKGKDELQQEEKKTAAKVTTTVTAAKETKQLKKHSRGASSKKSPAKKKSSSAKTARRFLRR